MRKARFTEEQISFAIRQAESGTPVVEVCRKISVSEQTYGGREPQAQEDRGGSFLGQAHASGGALKKGLRPGPASVRWRNI